MDNLFQGILWSLAGIIIGVLTVFLSPKKKKQLTFEHIKEDFIKILFTWAGVVAFFVLVMNK
ncbi:hypothetical protein [Defluviitalea phaphyphila]|uniref:hypothetical protein n=1 Tax=Defluviitalea phaphyphila TaxID=1473580 RepID=UPI0007305256|nr:hypothetical protein [Defluviitalea phaphyphila]